MNRIGANSASHKDTIQTNKKYYYTFRTVDFHGNVSNPSPIYEVELVDDEGRRYLLVKICELEAPKPYEYEKTVRKMIGIRPGVLHRDISPLTHQNMGSARANLNNF